MLTGTKAFPGDSAITTLTAILRDDVKPIAEMVPDVPPEVVEIIALALRKDPKDRWQSMQVMYTVLAAQKAKFDFGRDEQFGVRVAGGKAGVASAHVAAAAGLLARAHAGGSAVGTDAAEAEQQVDLDRDRAQFRVLGNLRAVV
jgi:hypothetical protein